MMRYGFSQILGQHLQPKEVDPYDFKLLRIVCPICAAPLKLQGEGQNPPFTHAASGTDGDCDRLVNAQVVEMQRISAKKDRTIYLMVSLRDAIEMIAEHPDRIEQEQDGLKLSGAAVLRHILWKLIQKKLPLQMPDILEISDNYQEERKAAGNPLKTTFSRSMQERLAYDMWLMSTAGDAHKSLYDFLFSHAYMRMLERLAAADPTATQREKTTNEAILAYAKRLLALDMRHAPNFKEAHSTIKEMARTKPGGPAAEGIATYHLLTLAEMTRQIIGTLLSLPYYELLVQWWQPEHATNRQRQPHGHAHPAPTKGATAAPPAAAPREIKFTYHGENLKIVRDTYREGGRLALFVVTDDEYQEPYTNLTVNLPDQPLEPGEFFVKTWSENSEISTAIFNTGEFINTGKAVPTGHVLAEVWRLREP